jgi:hypothetical protein
MPKHKRSAPRKKKSVPDNEEDNGDEDADEDNSKPTKRSKV